MTTTLTTKQQYWLDHLQRADASGKTLAQYATDANLNIHQLYSWRKQLRSLGALPSFSTRRESVPQFARVVEQSDVNHPATTTLQLSMGTVTFQFNTLPDIAWLTQIIRALEWHQ